MILIIARILKTCRIFKINCRKCCAKKAISPSVGVAAPLFAYERVVESSSFLWLNFARFVNCHDRESQPSGIYRLVASELELLG